jgi:short-subunit dehydrogenase
MKKVIIVGATSGIGKELAKVFSSKGYEVGITGRRTTHLEEVSKELSAKTHWAAMDVRDTDASVQTLEKLIADMGGSDIIVVNAGVGHENPSLDWRLEKDTIETNVLGFTALADAAMRHFIKNKSGHLVGISSIASIRGSDLFPAYNASKAFMSIYLEGMTRKMVKEHLPVAVTDIQPGFIDTPMTKAQKGMFWVAPAHKAAGQIYDAILKRKEKAYITGRWVIIAWVLRFLPGYFYKRL